MDDKKVYEVTVHRCIGVLVGAKDENEAKALAIEAADDAYLDEWEDTNTEVFYEPEEVCIEHLSDEEVNKIYPN